MNLNHLKYFYQLSQDRHFGEAANACNITQPTLSACIVSLEKELGVALVARDRVFIGLTEEGKLLAEFAKTTLRAQQDLNQALSLHKGNLSGILKIGIVPQSSTEIIQRITSFRRQFPKVKVRLKVLHNDAVMNQLKDHKIDLAIAFKQQQSLETIKSVMEYPLGELELAVLLPESLCDNFEQRQDIDLEHLTRYPMALLSREMHFRRRLDGLFKQIGKTIVADFESDSLFHLICAVEQGGLIAVVSLQSARMIQARFGINYRRVNANSMGETSIFTRKNSVSPIVVHFINIK